MKITYTKVIDCSAITAAECSDKCLVALGHSQTFKLKADTPDDVLHGSVSIVHNVPPLPHVIEIECYEQDKLPTIKLDGRRSTLKRPVVMPTENELKAKLDAMI